MFESLNLNYAFHACNVAGDMLAHIVLFDGIGLWIKDPLEYISELLAIGDVNDKSQH